MTTRLAAAQAEYDAALVQYEASRGTWVEAAADRRYDRAVTELAEARRAAAAARGPY